MPSPPETQADHFDTIADAYDESIPEHVMEHLTRRRRDLVRSLVPAGRVLDVGCGTGRLLDALPDAFDKVGIDVSDRMLAVARSKGLEVHQAGAASLPFPERSFDLATSFAVLHHLVERDVVRAALREMCRVVKPGGAVLVWDHNPLNPYWHLLMRRLPQDRGDERLVPARVIVDELSRAGMAGVHLRRLTFTPDFTPEGALPTVARIERVLESVPVVRGVAAHNVVTATRQ